MRARISLLYQLETFYLLNESLCSVPSHVTVGLGITQ